MLDISHRILLIEDDKALSSGICLALKSEGIVIDTAYDLKTARADCRHERYELLILDINLPDGNGLDFLHEIKGAGNTPVIILTANDMETDIVMGLEMGADDYITKPFSLAVLRARVHTQLRKNIPSASRNICIDNFVFDFERMEYTKSGYAVELSKTEQKLLRLLLENRGCTVTRSELVDRIWTDGASYVDENALSVSIKRLRDKLEDEPRNPRYIKTVYGIGYSWVAAK